MREIDNLSVVVAVWVIAIVGIRIMKKIQPGNKIYPVWAVIICILLTLFVGWHESWFTIFQ